MNHVNRNSVNTQYDQQTLVYEPCEHIQCEQTNNSSHISVPRLRSEPSSDCCLETWCEQTLQCDQCSQTPSVWSGWTVHLPVPRLMTEPSSDGDVFMIMAASTFLPDMLSGMVAASALNAWCDIAAILSKNVAFKPSSANLAVWKRTKPAPLTTNGNYQRILNLLRKTTYFFPKFFWSLGL